MAQIKIKIPGFEDSTGNEPIVILGPNGSGKTQLAQRIARENPVTAISAQRRTWVENSLPVQEQEQLRIHVKQQQDRWGNQSWQPTEEIDYILSTLIQDHTNLLTKRNEDAIQANLPFGPLRDTKLIQLQALWSALYPMRKLEIGGFFPKVKRLDAPSAAASYRLREMSDGERTVLYMAARVLAAEQEIILVDEPELHLHSRLAVRFWDEAEKLRRDCRFVYITHDLNFALSRRRAKYLVARSRESASPIFVDDLPSTIAADVLGAATLPFYARRIVLYEGQLGIGFASEFFSAWFDDSETFALPVGDRDSVCAAVAGLKKVGVAAAEITGLVDRDYDPDAILNALPAGVAVIPLHEIESALCDEQVVKSIASHFLKDATTIWDEFLARVRKEYRGQAFCNVVSKRVRARIGDLLDGAFKRSQIADDLSQTTSNHIESFSELNLPAKTAELFTEESKRVTAALSGTGSEMLAILPGKHLLAIVANVMGLSSTQEYTSLITRALQRKLMAQDEQVRLLGENIEKALLSYLPQRRV